MAGGGWRVVTDQIRISRQSDEGARPVGGLSSSALPPTAPALIAVRHTSHLLRPSPHTHPPTFPLSPQSPSCSAAADGAQLTVGAVPVPACRCSNGRVPHVVAVDRDARRGRPDGELRGGGEDQVSQEAEGGGHEGGGGAWGGGRSRDAGQAAEGEGGHGLSLRLRSPSPASSSLARRRRRPSGRCTAKAAPQRRRRRSQRLSPAALPPLRPPSHLR